MARTLASLVTEEVKDAMWQRKLRRHQNGDTDQDESDDDSDDVDDDDTLTSFDRDTIDGNTNIGDTTSGE